MIFPDCRKDENYNEDFLNEMDREFVRGMDFALEQVKNLLENNLDVYEEEMDYVPDEDEIVEEDEIYSKSCELYELMTDNAEFIANIVDDWMEMERDEMITSMIENMDNDEYTKLRAAAIERNNQLDDSNPLKKHYCDSRKLYNM